MHMRTVISYVSRYEDHFRAVMAQKLRLSSEAAIRGHKKRLAQAEKRLGIHLQIDMADLTTLRLNMEDFGFGEFFPATHQVRFRLLR